MTPEQLAAYVTAQAACAVAEIAAMQRANDDHANEYRSWIGPRPPPPHPPADFRAVQEHFCVGHNAVLALFER